MQHGRHARKIFPPMVQTRLVRTSLQTRAPMTSRPLIARAWARRELFFEITKREVTGRYSGSHLGIVWSFINPLLMLGVYTLAFREFLGMRWSSGESTRADFTLMIFCGMIVHTLLVECLTRAPTAIAGNANLVRKVVFPLALLPCVTVVSALFHAGLSVVVLLLFVLVAQHGLHLTVLYLPLIFLPYAILLSGVSWLMASLGVFIRDVSQVAAAIAAMLMFLSPVFYPASSLKEKYRVLIAYNPLTLIIEQTRAVVVFGDSPDWFALGVYAVVAVAVMAFGYWWFQRTRDGFADVL
jgi:lipopolysaccharide transport system permease protein